MLLKQVLGDDWHKLPPVIQQHYTLEEKQTLSLHGVMTIYYPCFLLPMVWLIHLFGGLVLWRGEAQTEVQKTWQAGVLYWRRFMTYQNGASDYFSSHMTNLAEHELIEHIGFGFALRLFVTVEHGDLVYRSNGHIWQCGNFTLNIADWLLLGSAVISEHAVSDDEFYLDFTLRHPLWGETYRYKGRFQCR